VKFEVGQGFTPLQLKTLRDQIFAFKSLKKNDITIELYLVACGACTRRHMCPISHAPTLTDRTTRPGSPLVAPSPPAVGLQRVGARTRSLSMNSMTLEQCHTIFCRPTVDALRR